MGEKPSSTTFLTYLCHPLSTDGFDNHSAPTSQPKQRLKSVPEISQFNQQHHGGKLLQPIEQQVSSLATYHAQSL
jgi:hypothetical protein